MAHAPPVTTLRAVAEGGRVGPAGGRHHRRARRRHPDDRQHLRSGPSAGRDGKTGGADHCLGRSWGGLTTKIHVVVDVQGLPIRLGLTAGQAHDGQIADTLLDHLVPRTIVLADKAYDADRIRELIQDQGATPNIPPKSNRRWKPCFSKRLYRERNLTERFFSKLKHFRRVATRYDKLAANFLAMIQLASMRLWLRAYESTA
jgi:transposase